MREPRSCSSRAVWVWRADRRCDTIWNAYIGTNQISWVLQNSYTLGSASIDIIGPDWSFGATNPYIGIIQGRYTLVLQGGGIYGPPWLSDVSVSQMGVVPADAKSIFLEERVGGNNCTVSLAGQLISLFVCGVGSNYTVCAGDVSAFAGLLTELRISTAITPDNFQCMNSIDAISFSTQVVPEPGCLGLVMLGSACCCLWRLTNRKAT